MILVTGSTGFIGRALVRHLVDEGRDVRALIRPSRQSPQLPRGLPVEAAISSINDPRSLRAALVGVHTVYHLVGAEWLGTGADLQDIEISGTQTLLQEAQEAGVERIFYLSHLGADRASAYPVLKAKAISEQFIQRSAIDYTILRCGLVFGPGDHFTTAIARILSLVPFFFPLPGDGRTLVQPLWIDDLVTALAWSLENPATLNRVFEVAGPEPLPIQDVISAVMQAIGLQRSILRVRPSYLRLGSLLFEYLFPRLPLSVYWIDYLSANRTCALDTLPKVFGLLSRRFAHNLEYLRATNWRRAMLRDLIQRRVQV